MVTFICLGRCSQTRLRSAINTVTVLLIKILAVLHGIWIAQAAWAQQVQFNDAFLPEDSTSRDLSQFETDNPVLPGEYSADVVVNERLVSRQDIQIGGAHDASGPQICFSRGLLELMGINLQSLSDPVMKRLESGPLCEDLGQLIEGATASFSPADLQLNASIPQVALRRSMRGYVSPELWDEGVTAGMLSYVFNSNHNRTDAGNTDSVYLGLNTGLNIGGWRLRHDGSTSWQREPGLNYQPLRTYAQHDVTSLQSQFTVGEANTRGDIFDTLAYRGVQLATDDRMLPESRRGYAPVIRGIARTNARVAVRQAGSLLYETTVAPGAFVIDDLYAAGFGGDLEVTVDEADGTQQRFNVPYTAVAQLLRPGTSRFSFTLGETRDNFLDRQARLVEGTYQRGLSNVITGYGAGQSSDDYRSLLAGMAVSTPIGAVALDVTRAQTGFESGVIGGQSLRLSYGTDILDTGSNFVVAATRFSTPDYLDFSSAIQLLDAERSGLDISQFSRPRSRLSLTLNQTLGDWGDVGFNGFSQNYWNQPGRDVQYQLRYSKQVGRLSYSLNASRGRTGTGALENSLLLTLSLPFELGASRQSTQLSARVIRDTQGDFSEQATLSGSAGENRQYSYSLTRGHEGASNTNSTSASGQYTGSKALVSGSLGHGQGYDSLSLSASGGLVTHANGVTLTPYRGETMAVVSAPGAEGATVVGYPGLKLDARGNAVLPYLRPYELNEVAIDPLGSSLDVELSETSQQVAPRAGAIVALEYGTNTGQAVLLNVSLEDGKPLPFGAGVVDDRGVSVGVIGQGGQLYARLKDGARRLTISWGSEAMQRCSLALPSVKSDGKRLNQLDVVCSYSAPENRVALQGGAQEKT
ncbi:fimbria/pilus outer membrane usher protein [Pseudomonas fluorescens]|uniref:fimbria/pilus outer membrane usher protein n=1 Tax=Pseudomonas fluorescens TaxID=294 RepID=UPI001A9FE435|nr:fimbria/pilus outer membrane usher protein [Pseudomonas fluorescens]QTD31489.1 fimbrial biogenesis outer membrane usher protein [Pseudomonas fluorescens]